MNNLDFENWVNERMNWLNYLKMSVALCICHAYTKKKLSLLKIANVKKIDDSNYKLNNKNEEKNAWNTSDKNNVSDNLLMSMS